MDQVYRGGTVITGEETYFDNPLASEGKIGHICAITSSAVAREIDAAGFNLMSGGIDVLTGMNTLELNARTTDDQATGTVAIAFSRKTAKMNFWRSADH